MDVMNARAREQAVLAELDAIHARCANGEITPEEADALHEAVVRRVHEETIVLGSLNRELREVRRRTRVLPAVIVVVIVLAFVAFLLVRP